MDFCRDASCSRVDVVCSSRSLTSFVRLAHPAAEPASPAAAATRAGSKDRCVENLLLMGCVVDDNSGTNANAKGKDTKQESSNDPSIVTFDVAVFLLLRNFVMINLC